jgi:uncharacterized protein (DUF4415 family)
MKDKNIIQHTRHTLPKGKTDWKRIKSLSEEEIAMAAEADPENPLWTAEMLDSATVRMPQKKVSVHMYLDQDIVQWFKSDGRGYQTRINSVLKSYVHKHTHTHF